MDKQPKPLPPLKRPPTAFMRYCKQVQKYVTLENPDLSDHKVALIINKMWDKLDDITKQKYKKEFIAEKKVYNAELAARVKAGIAIEPQTFCNTELAATLNAGIIVEPQKVPNTELTARLKAGIVVEPQKVPDTEKEKDTPRRIAPKPSIVIPDEAEQELLPPKALTPKPEGFCILCGVKKPGELRVIDPYGARNHMKVLPAAIEEVFSVGVDVKKIINTKSCIKCFNVIMRAQSMRRHYLAVVDGKEVAPVTDFVKYSYKVENIPTVLPKGAPPTPPEKQSPSSNSHATRATTVLDDAVAKIQQSPVTTSTLCRSPSVAAPETGKPPHIVLQFTPTVTPPADGTADGEVSSTDGANKKAVVTFTLTGISVKRPPNQDHQYCAAVRPDEQAQKILQKCGIFRHTIPTSVSPIPEVDTVVEAFRRNKDVRMQIEKQILSELSSFCNRMNSTISGPSILRTGLEQLPKTDIVSGCIIELENSMPFLLDVFKTLCCASHMPGDNTKRAVAMMYGVGMYSRNGQFSAMQYLNTMALMRYSGSHLQEVLSKSALMLSGGNGRHTITSKAHHIPALGLVKSEGVKLTRQRMDNLIDRILRQQNFPVPKTFVPYPIKVEESPMKRSRLLRSGKKKGRLGRIKREPCSKIRHKARGVKRELRSDGDGEEKAAGEGEVPFEHQETQRQRAAVPRRARGKKRSRMAVEDYLQTRVISIDTPLQNQCDDQASPAGSDGKENDRSQPAAKRRVVYDTPTGKNIQSDKTSPIGCSSHKNIRQQLMASQSETQLATRVLEGSLGMGANGGHLVVHEVSGGWEERTNTDTHPQQKVDICWEYDQQDTSTEPTHTQILFVDEHGVPIADSYQLAGSQESPIVLGSWQQ